MAIKTTFMRSILVLTLAGVPLFTGFSGLDSLAYAKGGNGGGNGNGGNGNGGNGNSDHSKSASGHEKSDNGAKGKGKHEKTNQGKSLSAHTPRTPRLDDTVQKTPALRSLNRNYHAYLNSKDPKMAAISAYAIAYAEFEAKNGVDAVPTDPDLSDDALRGALASFTKDGEVTDAMVNEAKSILGVGPEIGKIDQIRDSLTDTQTVE